MEHNRILTRPWLLLAAAVALLASHSLILRFALQHRGPSAAMVAGLMLLIVLTHLGLLSRLYAVFRRRSRQ